jgi:AraC-like DNA-binding protein
MLHQNICKFPAPSYSDMLCIRAFVLESKADVMQHPRVLSCHRAMLMLQGDARATVGGREYFLKGGTLLFAFCGEQIVLCDPRDVICVYVDFDGTRAEELFLRFGIGAKNRFFEGQDHLIPLWRESVARATDETVDLAAESVLLYAFSRLFAVAERQDPLLARIIKRSESGFADPTLSLSVIARELSYNDKYLSHYFKEKMKIGYAEYLRTLRMKYAISLFDHGLDSIKNVAILSGFADPLYFSSVFKKAVGLSPKEYIASRVGTGTSNA